MRTPITHRRFREALKITVFALVAAFACAAGERARGASDGLIAAAPAEMPEPGAVQQSSDIVARVNGEPVSAAELQRLLANREHAPGAGTTGETKPERRALQQLINRRLILQEAERRNLHVSEQELDQALIALRGRFPDLESFGMWMQGQGLNDESLFGSLRDNLLAARTAAALVEDVRIGEDAVRHYYETHQGELKTEDVWIQVIVVGSVDTAREIQAALADGENFGTLAQRHSLGRRAELGGDVGWVGSATLWPPMREALGSLAPGEAIGPLVRDEDEVLIVRLEDRRERPATFADARSGIERRLLAAEQQEVMRAWLSQQKKKSEIEVLLESD